MAAALHMKCAVQWRSIDLASLQQQRNVAELAAQAAPVLQSGRRVQRCAPHLGVLYAALLRNSMQRCCGPACMTETGGGTIARHGWRNCWGVKSKHDCSPPLRLGT